MPYQSIRLNPGVDIEKTPVLNQGGWSDSQLIRWQEGLPQKIGGWVKYYSSAMNSPVRALHSWLTSTHLSGQPESADRITLAAGCDQDLFLITKDAAGNLIPGASQSIAPTTISINVPANADTPIVSPVTFDFSTTTGSPIVSIITGVDHNLTEFSSVVFNTPVSVGGLIIYGSYAITPPVSGNHFNITANQNATATVAVGTGTIGPTNSANAFIPTFTTTSTFSTVTVNFPNHGVSANTEFNFIASTVVDSTQVGVPLADNIVIQGPYSVASIATGTPSNAFTIFADAPAQVSNTVNMNQGYVQAIYYPVVGPTQSGLPYGEGLFGRGPFGYGKTATGSSTLGSGGVSMAPVQGWTLDNWGTWLVACQDNGPIFYFNPQSNTRSAQLINNAPMTNHGIFVSMPLQILIAYGSSDINGVHDPMLVRWCDQGNFNQWTASSLTQAGSYRIPEGSEIIAGLSLGQQCILWTDYETWTMNYVGLPFVFGFNKISMATGIVSRHAAAQLADVTYWMGQGSFYSFGAAMPAGGMSGGVQEVPCTVWDKVFQNTNRMAQSKICAAANSVFNEISWFFASAATIPPTFKDTSQAGNTHSTTTIDGFPVFGDSTKTGNTHTSTTIDALSGSVVLANWQVGMSITGGGIPAGTTIASIDPGGFSITISQAATSTIVGLPLSVTGQSSITTSGWKVGMRISGTGIPSGATITAIASDGSNITISQAATSTATGIALTVINSDPSLAEPDTYVKYSLATGSWDYGLLQRTAWADQGVQGPPIGGAATGMLYQHEMSTNADGAAINSYIKTAWFLISEGDPVTFVDLLLPDFKFGLLGSSSTSTTNVLLTVETADWPTGPIHSYGPYTVTQNGHPTINGKFTPWINIRARGRMMRCTISSNDVNSFWRIGDIRYRGTPDGRRGD